MDITKKKILFICPKFHDYELMIKEKLEKFGAEVYYFPEKSYNLDFKIINNFFSGQMDEFQNKHYIKIFNEIKDIKFDYLFVIRGYKLSQEFLTKFKTKNPSCKLIMYQWDSQRTNNYAHLIPFFDKVTTFDFEDSEQFNLEYIPLFYTDDIKQYNSDKNNTIYDFFFMGFFFDERYQAVLKFRDYCNRNGYKLKSFLYMPLTTRLKYFLKGKKLDKDIVSFKHMNREEYIKTLAESKVMVDVSNPGQTGLAMRVIESLASNTKILTNNTNFVKDKKVAQSGMVMLFSLDKIELSKEFLNSNIKSDSNVVLSINEWLKKIFETL